MSENQNEKLENLKDNNLIKLYPFNGRSPYLIDKFYIIGYSYLALHKLLIKNTQKFIEEDNEKETKEPHKFNIEDSPDILNEIISDYNKVGLPNETILNMIYPKKLDFYYTSEEIGVINLKRANEKNSSNIASDFCKIDFKKDKSTPNFPKSFKVVFSSNPQSENNSKKSINGLAYIFYKKFNEKKIYDKKKYTFYIPYTFCITSEYPYFNSFYKLCKCFKKFYSQKAIYIPIEFLIYNIISLSPSPLNSDVIIDLESSIDQDNLFGNYNKVISNISNMINGDESKEVKKETIAVNNFNTDTDLKKMNGIQTLRKSGFVFIREENNDLKRNKTNLKKMSSSSLVFTNNNNISANKKNQKEYQEIKFKCLSGYPLIQYNLSKVLLNNLTPEKVIIIFLYTFLEKDVIFFSKDIEYLTLTLNAYLNLNFPLNDEKYYFIGAAISFEDFLYGNSEFGLKNYTSIIGINDQYRPDYKNKNLKIQDHLVIDLDKGENIYGLDENNNNVNERNKKLVKYIKKICDGYEDEKNTTLYKAIKNLYKRLKLIYDNINENNLKKNFTNYKNKYLDYNEGEDAPIINNLFRSVTLSNNIVSNQNINKKNREIQEAFYEFVHNICLYFYENLSIKAKEDDQYKEKDNKSKNNGKNEQSMNVIFNKNYAKEGEHAYTEEELIFLDELTDTMKFQSFVFGFLQSYNPIDLYKIPLTFTEEFLSIISRKKEQIDQNTKKIDFFNLIDSLYMEGKKSEKKSVNFDVINFNYFKKYKSFFDREIYDRSKTKYFPDNRHLIKFISGKSEQLLNENPSGQRVLIYQSYELDDNLLLKYLHLTKNLNKKEYIADFFGSFYVEENFLKDIKITQIESRIENQSIEKELLTNSDICCANIILLFTLSLKSLRETVDCQTFLGILFQDFTVFRKYYSLLIRTIYRLYQEQKNFTSTLCYYPCINSIRIKKLVPNEDLLNMINLFNKINVNDLNLQEEEHKKNVTKDEIIKDVQLYGEQLEEVPINESNLYVYHNFTSERFVSEAEIVEHINTINEADNIEINLKTGEKLFPRIRFNNGIHKIESFFLSQRILLENLYKEYNKYIEDLDDNKLSAKLILDACLNIFIFMRNQTEYEGKDDIFEVLQCIFYIFMNQLFILKSIKEKINN